MRNLVSLRPTLTLSDRAETFTAHTRNYPPEVKSTVSVFDFPMRTTCTDRDGCG